MNAQPIDVSFLRSVDENLIVDSNVLLLFLVGDINPAYIKQFERTRNYEAADYDALNTVFTACRGRIATTTHVLAEVSNLANKLKGDRRAQFFSKFALWIEALNEKTAVGAEICRLDLFDAFGITDLGILMCARRNHTVLTDDDRLSYHLQGQGVSVITLAQIRGLT